MTRFFSMDRAATALHGAGFRHRRRPGVLRVRCLYSLDSLMCEHGPCRAAAGATSTDVTQQADPGNQAGSIVGSRTIHHRAVMYWQCTSAAWTTRWTLLTRTRVRPHHHLAQAAADPAAAAISGAISFVGQNVTRQQPTACQRVDLGYTAKRNILHRWQMHLGDFFAR